MSPRFALPFYFICAAVLTLGGCASTPDIDEASLPPEATEDDGIDYYSSTDSNDDLLAYGDDQWTTDEQGNRVYLLKRLRRGKSMSYYVGDVRYLYGNYQSPSARSTGYGSVPVYASSGRGNPLHSQTFRGSNNNTYYQTRRGRIIYLPQANPTQANPPQSSNSTSGPSDVSRPSPAAAQPSPPITTSAPPRPVAPPIRQQPPRARPANESRRRDR